MQPRWAGRCGQVGKRWGVQVVTWQAGGGSIRAWVDPDRDREAGRFPWVGGKCGGKGGKVGRE